MRVSSITQPLPLGTAVLEMKPKLAASWVKSAPTHDAQRHPIPCRESGGLLVVSEMPTATGSTFLGGFTAQRPEPSQHDEHGIRIAV